MFDWKVHNPQRHLMKKAGTGKVPAPIAPSNILESDAIQLCEESVLESIDFIINEVLVKIEKRDAEQSRVIIIDHDEL